MTGTLALLAILVAMSTAVYVLAAYLAEIATAYAILALLYALLT